MACGGSGGENDSASRPSLPLVTWTINVGEQSWIENLLFDWVDWPKLFNLNWDNMVVSSRNFHLSHFATFAVVSLRRMLAYSQSNSATLHSCLP